VNLRRLRVPFLITVMMAVVALVMTEMVLRIVRPVQAWRRDRQADFAVYRTVRGLKTRTDVERTLTGWAARNVDGSRCESAARYNQQDPQVCKAAAREVAYRRRPVGSYPPGLVPRQILVVYDAQGGVVTTTTFD
jgi:hypothetical protein